MTGTRGLREGAVARFVALALLVGSVWPSPPKILQAIETFSLDLRFRPRGVETPKTALAVILVDDPRLARLGAWPLDCRFYARAVDGLDAAGERSIVLDRLLGETDRTGSAPIRPGRGWGYRAASRFREGSQPIGTAMATAPRGAGECRL